MALSTRELYLVLRARDEASKVVQGLARNFSDVDSAAMQAAQNQIKAGAALATIGVGMAGIGVAALNWLKGTADAAAEFDRQVALVKTQTDGVQVSMKQLGDITKAVGNDVAVPLDQLNDGLYNIFSSMNVTVPQAQTLLTSFAKEAVAGQVDVQDASKATIGVLNGFHLPVEDVNHVLDVQFQLVRKGVGTFGDFADAIGKATPSAARAGQSVETLAGMMAYMTRNGMSAAEATAASSRALDALANPKTVQRLEQMGVKVKDQNGEFRSMGDIVVDLQNKLGTLTTPERAAALQNLLKSSGGTIQARRFYDMVLKDQQSAQQFVGLVGDMQNSSGAFTEAYNTMADTTASRSQLLANRWQEMKISIGEALIPVLNQLIGFLGILVNWWNNLSDRTQNIITIFAAVAAASFVVVGVIIAVAGAVLMLSGACAALDIALLPVILVIGAVIAAVFAVVAVIIFWNDIVHALGDAWNWLVGLAKTVWGAITSTVQVFGDNFMSVLGSIGGFFTTIWNGIVSGAHTIGDAFVWLWSNVISPTFNVIGLIFRWLYAIFFTVLILPMYLLIHDLLQPAFEWLYKVAIKPAIDNTIAAFNYFHDNIWVPLVNAFQWGVNLIGSFFSWLNDNIVQPIVGKINDGITWLQNVWTGVSIVVQNYWQAVGDKFRWVNDNIIQPVAHVIADIINWLKGVWNDVTMAVQARWQAMGDRINQIADWIKNNIFNPFMDAIHWIGQRFEDVGNWIGNTWDSIKEKCRGPVQWVIDVVYNNGIRKVWNPIADIFGLPQAPEVKLATGGIMPISPFKTNGPIAIVGEGNQTYPEFVIPTDPKFGANAAGLWAAAGKELGFFAGGGVIGDIGNFVGNLFSEGPIAAVKDVFKGVTDSANGTPGGGDWRKFLVGIPGKVVEGAIDKAKSWLSNLFGGFGTQNIGDILGAQKWAPLVAAALAMLGQPQSLIPNVLRRMNQESGGNPAAINLWDSNAAKGTPSMGLMQVILPTFLAYAGQLVGRGIWDPLANIFAGLNYALHRYGSIQAAMDKPGGYLMGTPWVPEDQLAYLHQGEAVIPADVNAARLNGVGAQQNFYITTQEIDPRKHAADLGWELSVRTGV